MDFALVMQKLGEFFLKYCSTEIVFNGYCFTVGSVYLFCAIAVLLIWFVKGLGE